MSEPAIRIEGLTKIYHLGGEECPRGRFRYKSLRESLSQGFRALVGSHAGNKKSEDRTILWALNDISFKVQPGEVIGIIGRNGAGKSTLLKILSRITEPTSGFAEIDGRVGSLLEVGTGFHPELTGRENIFLNGAILGMSQAEIKRKFDQIVAFSEVERFLDTPVKHYSSGMYTRLAFAVAAHLDTEILVVDEVLAVGDAEFQKKCLGKMQSVAIQEGRTVLFVSHNMSAVRALCTRGILLAQGKVQADGDVESVVAAYAAGMGASAEAVWSDTDADGDQRVSFKEIRAHLEGQQPDLLLACDLLVHCKENGPRCFVCVDICDSLGCSLMQALPSPKPFTEARAGLHPIRLEINLPPLVPDNYTADFWIGPHFSETLDYRKKAVAFEINETPTRGRTYPHYRSHGWMVPKSIVKYAPSST